ncbi:NAD(P)H nitroreductase [Nocardiaceae bacterium YC2-7]|uniref:NAD(P)H nitroreductase n=2 Tax=Antrihabitans stalactiti TaxID=2584121 RepID=A0A848K5D3_9NOCA|nr:NAD(P)H nitroreductase [Antrihabitans stalactiti]
MPTDEVLRDAVALACRAPSLHNSQPWQWIKQGESLDLFGDSDRILPSTDAFGRQMIISCGVALNHVQSAFAAVGWSTTVARIPNPNNAKHLARISFRRSPNISEPEVERAAAIARRRTDRLPLAEPADWATFEMVVRNILARYETDLAVLPTESRPELAKASELTAGIRRYDSMYQAELNWWSGHSGLAEGVPRDALVSRAEDRRVDVGRRFPALDTIERRGEIGEDRATIVVLMTRGESPQELLSCGEALSALLLEATIDGMATCPLTHITEIPQSRAIVRKLLGGKGFPQVIVRLGVAPKGTDQPPATLRKPLADVLEFRS